MTIPVRVLRRNWLLPLAGLIAAAIGYGCMHLENRLGMFGLVPLSMGLVLAVASVLRNSYPLGTPATLVATSASLDVSGRTIEASRLTGAKIVARLGHDVDTVATFTLREGGRISMWMKHAEAAALLDLLQLSAGAGRSAFALVLRFRTRFAFGLALAGVPLLTLVAVQTPIQRWVDAAVAAAIPVALVALVISMLLGLVRGRVEIGADGFTRSWLGRDRFVRFSNVDAVTHVGAQSADTIVRLRSGRRILLRALDHPDRDVDRGAESRALFEHLEAAAERFQKRETTEATLESMLERGGRTDEAWLADLDALLRGGAVRYRIATVEPARIAAVLRDPGRAAQHRVAAAAALVRFDPDYRAVVQRAADACAQSELQADLAAVGEAEDEAEMKAALTRYRG